MKKRTISLLAVILVAVGFLYHNLSGIFNKEIDYINVDVVPAGVSSTWSEGIAEGRFINAYVKRIVDGDTIEVKYKGENFTVRLLDIDTPESVKQGVAVQKYSKEATAFTKKMVLNKNVKLVFEKGLRDKYGRLLAHVLLEDGKYLNGLLVRNGYARVEVLSPNTAYRDYFNKLQDDAVKDKAGLWSLPVDKQPFVKEGSGEYIPRYWQNEKAS